MNNKYMDSTEKRVPLLEWAKENNIRKFSIVTTAVQQKQIMCDNDGKLIAWISYGISKGKGHEAIARYIAANAATLEVVFKGDSLIPIVQIKKEPEVKDVLTF
jgi:hypothetical protein